MKTKLASGEVKSEKMSKSLGNVVGAREAIDDLGPDLLRYVVLSTHYRSPIDFSDDVVAANRKALGALLRLFERIERLTGKSVRDKQPRYRCRGQRIARWRACRVRPRSLWA